MQPVFCSWSGGKDCCLALYRAINNGLDVQYLVNTVSEDGQRSRSHGVFSEVIRMQSQALGIPIVQGRTTNENYEEVFVGMLKGLKQKGVEGGVFGDIDYPPHREWEENVCRRAGMQAYLPLWQEDQQSLVEEFIDAGFESVIVTAKDLTLEERAQLQAQAAALMHKGQFSAEEFMKTLRRAAARGVGGGEHG